MTGYDCFADDYQNYVSSMKQQSVSEVDAIGVGSSSTSEVVGAGGCAEVIRRPGIEVSGGCAGIIRRPDIQVSGGCADIVRRPEMAGGCIGAYAPLEWWPEQE